MHQNSIHKIIEVLGLAPHPEGGYFKETYRSTDEILQDCLPDDYKGNRNYSTCIYFLLTSDDFSAFHRIKQDEIWHFYDGSPLRLHSISASGLHETHIMVNGPNSLFPGVVGLARKLSRKILIA